MSWKTEIHFQTQEDKKKEKKRQKEDKKTKFKFIHFLVL